MASIRDLSAAAEQYLIGGYSGPEITDLLVERYGSESIARINASIGLAVQRVSGQLSAITGQAPSTPLSVIVPYTAGRSVVTVESLIEYTRRDGSRGDMTIRENVSPDSSIEDVEYTMLERAGDVMSQGIAESDRAIVQLGISVLLKGVF